MQGHPAAREHGATASLERPLPAADPVITCWRIGNDVVLGVASLLSVMQKPTGEPSEVCVYIYVWMYYFVLAALDV